jgi:ATP-dependent Clp protease ATP-binding subunit ClpB
MFNPLGKNELFQIAKIKIEMLKVKLRDKNISFEISDQKLKELVDSSFDPSFGARPLERAIKDQIESNIAQKIISGEIKEGGVIKW